MSDIEITPLPDGAAVRFARDRERNRRFRARFPAARWGAGTQSWHIPGKTAARRAALWAAGEEEAMILARRRRQWHEQDAAWDRAGERLTAPAIAAETVAPRGPARQGWRPDEAAATRILAALRARYPDADAEWLRPRIAAGLGLGDHAMTGRSRLTYLEPCLIAIDRMPEGVMHDRSGAGSHIPLWSDRVPATAALLEALLGARLMYELRPRSSMFTTIGGGR